MTSLNLSYKKLTQLKLLGLTLWCYDIEGNVLTHSLEGVINLDCSDNQLSSLPVLPDTLKELDCSYNRLQTLPDLPKALKTLFCFSNRLQTLPELPKALKQLHCHVNRLQTLPELPKRLKELCCSNNYLPVLKELPKTLTWFECHNNPLVFIFPLPKRPRYYYGVPKNLTLLHSPENYPIYFTKYQTYRHLVSFLILETNMLPLVVNNNHFWFPNFI